MTEVMDDMVPARKQLLLGGVFLVAGLVGLPLLVVYGIDYWAAWLLLGIFLLVGGGGVAVTLPRIRRRAVPFLVLLPEGFRCPGVAEPLIPWADVDTVAVNGFNGSVNTSVTFKPGRPLPTRDGSRANVRVSRRRRMLSIGGPAPRGMSLEDYGALILRHAAPDDAFVTEAGG